MARIARVVLPGYPHHVMQRGSRRQQTFFNEKDYRLYLGFMARWCRYHQVVIWAYCLMPNHVHLVAVPETSDGLARGIGEAHRRSALQINQREGWCGHLWQELSRCLTAENRLFKACGDQIGQSPNVIEMDMGQHQADQVFYSKVDVG